MKPRGIITNIQRFSLHDGPGIRTTVFFKGCPLRCLWCHNPETYAGERELCYKKSQCIACGQCVEECSQGALSAGTDGLRYTKASCIHCFHCAQNCPSRALFVCGESRSVEETAEEILLDKGLYKSSGGGVTFSGGEATLQSEFVISLASRLKRENLHLALDTCGYCKPEIFRKVVKEMDLCLFDIKHSDADRHKELTGTDNWLIMENLAYLNGMGKKIQIRIPVIPGMNDSRDNFERISEILSDMEMVEEVMLLGYHPLGLSKVFQFDGHQKDFKIRQPKKEELEEVQAFLQVRLPSVKIRFR